MRETWLRTNRRILYLGMIFPGLAIFIGLLLMWLKAALPWTVALVGLGILMASLIAWQLSVPRLAYSSEELLVYLRIGPPFRLPVEFAECFFVSSGAGHVSISRGDLPIRNLVMRIAERATDYQHFAGNMPFGSWSDGYISFYGAWCEPIDLELVQKLNFKLSSARQTQLQNE
jgi:hypothetical protein